ncbi:hypothetical protein SUT286_11050 [Streptococcus parasuis]|nr:hypothetical protein SUT286_11050 [Streptococcus parasuis]
MYASNVKVAIRNKYLFTQSQNKSENGLTIGFPRFRKVCFFCFGTHILKSNVGSELISNFILCFLSDMGIDVHGGLDVLVT